MTFRLLIVLLFIVSSSYSQDSIEWGQLVKTKGQVNKIMPLNGVDFFSIRYQGGTVLGGNYLGHHANFSLVKTGKIKSSVSNSTAIIEFVSMVNGSPYVFLSDRVGDKKILYAQKYDTACIPVDDPIKLSEFEVVNNGWKSKGDFNLLFSKSKNFFCVEFDIPGNREDNEHFGYKVFTSDFEVISQGEYSLPYLKSEAIISKRYLSNTGDYFLSVKVFDDVEKKGLFKESRSVAKVVLMQVTTDGLEEYTIDLEGKKINELTFSSDNNRILTFSGLYGDKVKGSNGVKGVFYFRLNFDSKEVLDDGFKDFDKGFITEDWTDREKDRADKEELKGKGSPELSNYDIRDMVTLSDGSIIGMLEQFFVNSVTYTDPRGYSRTTYYYNYNDVIVYKINPEGDFEWLKKIPKTQITTNDYGYYSSVATFVSSSNLVFFFNDHIKNYNEAGEFISNEYSTSFTRKTNTVARVKIDLQTGDVQRTNFVKTFDSESIAIPKLFETDYLKNEMLMVFRYGKKEKYGLIRF